ncbi:hypothetical protein FOZ62_015829 [Perkinsus olseni]|uniref:K Homology domain-containing protein n=2 Tax=Perkinsus olseni TaxID=32597 RepID=A0A7J6S2K5_PEROL|nr:hypothetical protein FOZ62_015829 [Perkinsus olseni]
MGHKKKGKPKPKQQPQAAAKVEESPVPAPSSPEDTLERASVSSQSSSGFVMSTSARRRKNKLRNEQKAKEAAGVVTVPNEAQLPAVPTEATAHFEELAAKLEKEGTLLKASKTDRSSSDEFIRKLTHTVESERAALQPKPSFRGTVQQLRLQIYDLSAALDGSENSNSIDAKEAKAMQEELETQLGRLVEQEAFRAFQHHVNAIKSAVQQRQQQQQQSQWKKESPPKPARPPRAPQEGAAGRVAHRLQQILGLEEAPRPEQLHNKEIAKDAGVSAILLDLLFPNGNSGPLAQKWEKEYRVCLQPWMGEKRTLKGVRVTAVTEEAVDNAAARLGNFNPSSSRCTSLLPDNGNTNPNVLTNIRRRVFQLAHQLEGRHGVAIVKDAKGDSITIYGPEAEQIDKVVEELHTAVNERPRPRTSSGGGGGDHREGGNRRGEFRDTSLKLDVGVAKCVVGDRGENVRKLEFLSKCQIQIKGPPPDPNAHKNTGTANVTIRGANANDVATGLRMVREYANSVARRVVKCASKEVLDRLFGAGQSAHSSVASRFATIRRQCGCTILRDSDTTLQVLLPLDKDPSLEREIDGAVKDIQQLVEEASLATTTIPVSPEHSHIWADAANLRNIQRKAGLVRLSLRKGGEGQGARLELLGNGQAVSKARTMIDKLIDTSGTAEVFETVKECEGDLQLAEAVVNMLSTNRAATLHQIARDSGTTLHIEDGRKGGEVRNVKVVGGPTEVALAIKLLRRAVAEHRALLALMTTKEVEIPSDKVPSVLGPGGRTLHKIQTLTLCTDVQLSKRTEAGSAAVCVIRGAEEAVKKADMMLKEIIESGTSARLHQNGTIEGEPAPAEGKFMGARDAQPRLRNKMRGGAWGGGTAAVAKGASSSSKSRGGAAAKPARKDFVFDESDFPALPGKSKAKEEKAAGEAQKESSK